ncbi:DUF2480 family protein [Polluticaenibacter yanchengensis]|uniref:DUF2480 family protein n=1 Tax=Polluticaenibacter yanchengensis TaxID=3014562 RepID=A0ABT4UJD9_9BACT|nr:DUF2480 family protein [Chitinophagaceae bacterium LY-5]
METEGFVNKVENSGIVALDLIDFKPDTHIIAFDLKEHLYMGLIVKEKEFRQSVSELDFTLYKNKAVAIFCSVDTIIPTWVYMFLADKLYTSASFVDFKSPEELHTDLWKSNLIAADLLHFKDKKVVVRARPAIPPALFILATNLLKPLVKTLMYGEIGMPKVISKS